MPAQKKIIELLKEAEESKKPFFSLEFFPPRTEEGLVNLKKRFHKMAEYGPQSPLFMDVTWGAGGSTSDLTVDLCTYIQKNCSQANMHITCTNMEESKIFEGLKSAKAAGISNIVALRGDPPAGEKKWAAVEGGFSCALDLIKFVRKEYQDYFCISVAGYPEGHPDSDSVDKCMRYLKEKCDAGGDIIITQLFYDVPLFIAWVKKCREIGITVPILPGIMPIQSYTGFKKMTKFCKTRVPKEVEEELEKIKDDPAAVKEYGIKLGVKMCKELLDSGVVPGLHMYTLNQEYVTCRILEELGMVAKGTSPVPKKNSSPAQTSPTKSVAKKHKGEADEVSASTDTST